MINALMVLGFVILAALLIGVVIRRWPRSTTIFCPLREQIVEMKGGKCLARDDRGFVVAGSIWDCQRPCLDRPGGQTATATRASGGEQ